MSCVRLFLFLLSLVTPWAVMGTGLPEIEEGFLPHLGTVLEYNQAFQEGCKTLTTHTENRRSLPEFEQWLQDPEFRENFESILGHSRYGTQRFMRLLSEHLRSPHPMDNLDHFQAIYDRAQNTHPGTKEAFVKARNVLLGEETVEKGEILDARFTLAFWDQDFDDQGLKLEEWFRALLLETFRGAFYEPVEAVYAALASTEDGIEGFEVSQIHAYTRFKTLFQRHEALLYEPLRSPLLPSLTSLWEKDIERYNTAARKLFLFSLGEKDLVTQQELLDQAAQLWIPRAQQCVLELWQAGWSLDDIAETLPDLKDAMEQIKKMYPLQSQRSHLGFADFLEDYWQLRLLHSDDQGTKDPTKQCSGLYKHSGSIKKPILKGLAALKKTKADQIRMLAQSLEDYKAALSPDHQASFLGAVKDLKNKITGQSPLRMRAGAGLGEALPTTQEGTIAQYTAHSAQNLLTFWKQVVEFEEQNQDLSIIAGGETTALLQTTGKLFGTAFGHLRHFMIPYTIFLSDSIVAACNLNKSEGETTSLQNLWRGTEQAPGVEDLLTVGKENFLEALTLHLVTIESNNQQALRTTEELLSPTEEPLSPTTEKSLAILESLRGASELP